MLEFFFKISNKLEPVFHPVDKGLDKKAQVFETQGYMCIIKREGFRYPVQYPYIHIIKQESGFVQINTHP